MELITDKLSTAFYATKSVKPFPLLETLNMVGFAYFHSVMNYGLILCRNPSHTNIFKKQKNITRILTGCSSRDLCRDLFKTLKILPLQSQCILTSLICG